jgi:hypothetical protein
LVARGQRFTHSSEVDRDAVVAGGGEALGIRIVRFSALGAVVLAAVACGGLETSELQIAATDGGVDGQALSSQGRDSSTPVLGRDSGSSSSVAASSTAASSSAAPYDAGSGVADATKRGDTGAGPGEPSVPCGVFTCDANTPVCCLSGFISGTPTTSCATQTTTCPVNSISSTCSPTEKCPSGGTCCATLNSSGRFTHVECEASCTGAGKIQVCDPNGADVCASGQTCHEVVKGYGYCAVNPGSGT